MNQKEKVKDRIDEVNSVEEKKAPKEKEMSFKSMLEQFYKKTFESLPEPEKPSAPQSFIAAH